MDFNRRRFVGASGAALSAIGLVGPRRRSERSQPLRGRQDRHWLPAGRHLGHAVPARRRNLRGTTKSAVVENKGERAARSRCEP